VPKDTNLVAFAGDVVVDVPLGMQPIVPTLAEAIWENAPDAILLVDDGGCIARVNDAAEKLFGYDRNELMGEDIEILIPERVRAIHVEKRHAFEGDPHTRHIDSPLSALVALNKAGEEFDVEVALSPLVHDDRHWTVAVVRDVRGRKVLEKKLRWASTHDALTELFNRGYLEEELSRLAKGRRFPVALIVIDIDGLKPVNDQLGHATGDRLLIDAAALFSSMARGDDVVARVGGDEFVMVLPETTQEAAEQALVRLRDAVRHHNATTEGPHVHFSAGVAVAVEPGLIAAAMRSADNRMYANKRARRGLVR
jgi:diguanylate cyclase (GGDEF)-like protein/PAS domain S-box-containing protein